MQKFNTKATIKNLIEIHTTQESSKREAMQPLVAEFGETPLLPYKQGGLNGNAFRAGSKLETRQAAADACGLSLEKAESLAAIIQGVNAHRATLWQDYQIAHFGLDKIKPTKAPAAPSEESLERKAKAEERTAQKARAQMLRRKAKIASANATIAAASGDKDKQGEFKREADDLKASAKAADEIAKEITAELTEAKEGNKRERLLNKVIELRDEIKNAKIIDGEIDGMTFGDLIHNYLV
jgi:hypothetical protein